MEFLNSKWNYERVVEWAGLNIIGGYSAYIQVCGAQMNCFFCKKYGHVRKKMF